MTDPREPPEQEVLKSSDALDRWIANGRAGTLDPRASSMLRAREALSGDRPDDAAVDRLVNSVIGALDAEDEPTGDTRERGNSGPGVGRSLEGPDRVRRMRNRLLIPVAAAVVVLFAGLGATSLLRTSTDESADSAASAVAEADSGVESGVEAESGVAAPEEGSPSTETPPIGTPPTTVGAVGESPSDSTTDSDFDERTQRNDAAGATGGTPQTNDPATGLGSEGTAGATSAPTGSPFAGVRTLLVVPLG
ncbi:MAG: hypothetical protein ACK5O2_01065 [Microthrixaceae bacterium]